MTEQKTEEQYEGPFDLHHDHDAWEAGFEYGVELLVSLTSPWADGANSLPTKAELQSREAQATLWAATGCCMACGSVAALEFKPRLPGRASIWLCRRDLRRFLTVHSPFPGDDPDPVDPLTQDQPMWFAGLLTAVAQCAPMVKAPSRKAGKER